MAKWLVLAGGILLAAAVGAGVFVYFSMFETEVHAEYTPPAQPPDDVLVDDRLEDRNPKFDPDVVHRREEQGWRVNASAAVIRLDVPMVRPDAVTLIAGPPSATTLPTAPGTARIDTDLVMTTVAPL